MFKVEFTSDYVTFENLPKPIIRERKVPHEKLITVMAKALEAMDGEGDIRAWQEEVNRFNPQDFEPVVMIKENGIIYEEKPQ